MTQKNKFLGNHGYVKINGVTQALARSWSMSESEVLPGKPGNRRGKGMHTISIEMSAHQTERLSIERGCFVDLSLLEGGTANYFHHLTECEVTSIAFSGAAVNQLVTRTIELRTYQPREVKSVI